MDEVVKRNFTALSDGLKAQRETNSAQDIKIRHMDRMLGEQAIQIKHLKVQLALLAANTGTGATAR